MSAVPIHRLREMVTRETFKGASTDEANSMAAELLVIRPQVAAFEELSRENWTFYTNLRDLPFWRRLAWAFTRREPAYVGVGARSSEKCPEYGSVGCMVRGAGHLCWGPDVKLGHDAVGTGA